MSSPLHSGMHHLPPLHRLGRFTVFHEKSMPLSQWQNYTKGARAAASGTADGAADGSHAPAPAGGGLPTPHTFPGPVMAGIVTPRSTAATPRPGQRRVYKQVPVSQRSFEHAVAALSTVRDYMFTLSVAQGLNPPVPANRRGTGAPGTPVGEGPRPAPQLGSSTADPTRPPRASTAPAVDMESIQAQRRKAEARVRALEGQVRTLQESLTVAQQREARAAMQASRPAGAPGATG